jgi:RNA-binding protein
MNLTGKQKRFLRGLGNQLKATIFIGREGISNGVITSIEQTLAANELVKIKLLEGFAGDRHAAAEELAAKTNAELVQVLGKTVLLYRRHISEPKISLPE